MPRNEPVPIPMMDESELPIPLVSDIVHDSSLLDPHPPRKLEGAADGGVVFLDGVGLALAVVLEDASPDECPSPRAASL